MDKAGNERRYPIGAEIVGEGVHFRVFAPKCRHVDLVLEDPSSEINACFPLKAEGNGYFSNALSAARDGSLYRFKLDGRNELFPDPASRFQPQGPFGPSQIIGSSFAWQDRSWHGVGKGPHILYEMHVGTFTPEGTYAAAEQQLAELADLGITVIEMMPVNEFPGKFGWGYDGVNLFAPTRLYGSPNDLKSFIQSAHALSISVILDVVYNHFGPEGNFILEFADDYLAAEETEWGRGINFDNNAVREFFLANVRYWIEEYHFDGLRFDATQNISSNTPTHILAALCTEAKETGRKLGRKIFVIGENEPQEACLLRNREEGGYGFDALWNDDFHHTAIVRLTGKREAYYTDYLGSPQELISCSKYGFLYQGQYYVWQEKPRGSPSLDLPPEAFVIFLQNHDQIANSGQGKRIMQISDFGNYKAMTCLLLIAPGNPLLFQGQEFGSSSPFLYFADHAGNLHRQIHHGRKEFLSQFRHLATQEAQANLPNPTDFSTFIKSKLDFTERQSHAEVYALHKDLIKLRRYDAVFSHPLKVDGAVLNANAFILRFFGEENNDRLLLINFGIDMDLCPLPEPLLAPCEGGPWEILWSSESLCYGGQGAFPIEDSPWQLQGHSALILKKR